MERKLNAVHKTKSRSQPDLYKVSADGRGVLTSRGARSVEDELFEMCALSGVKIDNDVFRIVLDLLRLNVNPNTMVDVLRKMSTQQAVASRRQASQMNETSENTLVGKKSVSRISQKKSTGNESPLL